MLVADYPSSIEEPETDIYGDPQEQIPDFSQTQTLPSYMYPKHIDQLPTDLPSTPPAKSSQSHLGQYQAPPNRPSQIHPDLQGCPPPSQATPSQQPQTAPSPWPSNKGIGPPGPTRARPSQTHAGQSEALPGPFQTRPRPPLAQPQPGSSQTHPRPSQPGTSQASRIGKQPQPFNKLHY
jgi:hypothetical protein